MVTVRSTRAKPYGEGATVAERISRKRADRHCQRLYPDVNWRDAPMWTERVAPTTQPATLATRRLCTTGSPMPSAGSYATPMHL